MNLSFALPGLLWALAALALPLLLHLVRRERQQRTVFAALAWLEARQRPRARLRLEQWLLLALRMALLAVLALLLAGLQRDLPPAPAEVTLVHPALPAPAGLPPEDVRWQWLAPGFPPTTAPAPAADAAVASLLRQADAELPEGTRLRVQVPATLEGLDAAPLRLSRAVDWQVQPTPAPAETDAVPPGPPPTLALRGNAADPGQRWLRAVQAAWRAGREDAGSPDAGPADAPLPPTDHVLAWTSAGAPDDATLDWVARGGRLLLDATTPWPIERTPVALDSEGWLQGAALGRGQVLQWRRPLDPQALPALLGADFPTRLHAALSPTPAPARADADAVTPVTGAAAPQPAPAPLDTPLLWLAALLFALERALALWPARRPSR